MFVSCMLFQVVGYNLLGCVILLQYNSLWVTCLKTFNIRIQDLCTFWKNNRYFIGWAANIWKAILYWQLRLQHMITFLEIRSSWCRSLLCCLCTLCSSPDQHQQNFSGPHAFKVTYKHLPQPITSHIQSLLFDYEYKYDKNWYEIKILNSGKSI